MKWACCLLFLAGCAMGPDPHTPGICMPDAYAEGPGEDQEIDLAHFWTQFDDALLNDLIEEALACNLELQIALRRIEEVRAQCRIESALLYPQIQQNFIATRSKSGASTDVIESAGAVTEIVPSDPSNSSVQRFFQLGFDAAWELDLWGKNRRRSQAARSDFQAVQEEALEVQIALVGDVARTYIDTRMLQSQIQVQTEQVARTQGLLDLAESRFEAGLCSYLDVTRASAALDAQMAELCPLQKSMQQAIYGLATLLGRQPQEFSIEEGEIPIAAGKVPAGLPSELLCRRPDIRRAEAELHAAIARIGEAKGGLFPSFSLTGSSGVQAAALSQLLSWPSRYWAVGPAMVWNLFTGGRLSGQVRVANERQKQALLTYEKTILTALSDVEGQLVGYFKEERRLSALTSRAKVDQLSFELTLDQYLAGVVSFDEVLRAEATHNVAQLELIESRGTLMVQLIGLYKALGGGWTCCHLP